MIPDVEAVVGSYLRSALSTLGVQVVGRTPSNTSEPWVRLTLINALAAAGDPADHAIAADLQLDCYSGADGWQEEANDIAAAARAAIVTIGDADHGGVVVGGGRITGHTRIPDTDFEPARERVIILAVVWCHS